MNWNQFDNKRKPFFRLGKKVFKAALKKQIEPFLNDIEKADSVQRIQAFASAVTVDRMVMQKAYKEVYSATGPVFAKFFYNDILKLKSLEDSYFQEYFNQFVATECGDRITDVTDYTKEQIVEATRNAIDEGIKENWSTQKIAKEITKKLDKMTAWRAERIARTEVVSASNRGSLLGAQATGMKLKKIWVNSGDSRVRDKHRGIEPVGINEAFNVGGESMMYPGATGASASNVVHCRCTMVYEKI